MELLPLELIEIIAYYCSSQDKIRFSWSWSKYFRFLLVDKQKEEHLRKTRENGSINITLNGNCLFGMFNTIKVIVGSYDLILLRRDSMLYRYTPRNRKARLLFSRVKDVQQINGKLFLKFFDGEERNIGSTGFKLCTSSKINEMDYTFEKNVLSVGQITIPQVSVVEYFHLGLIYLNYLGEIHLIEINLGIAKNVILEQKPPIKIIRIIVVREMVYCLGRDGKMYEFIVFPDGRGEFIPKPRLDKMVTAFVWDDKTYYVMTI